MCPALSTTRAESESLKDAVTKLDSPRVSVDELLGTARTGTVRTERSRRTRTALVAGVRDELRRSGTFTADSVAELVGCSTATFYGHFATKDDALASAFELVLIDLDSTIDETLTIDTLEDNGLDTTIEMWVDRQAEFFRHESLVFRAALARLPFHRGIRHAYREAERLSMDRLVSLILAGQTVGSVRTGDPVELAEAFLVLSQGLNNPHVLRPDANAVRAHLVRAIIATLANTMTRGDDEQTHRPT